MTTATHYVFLWWWRLNTTPLMTCLISLVHRQTSSRSSSWRRMSYSRPPSPSPGRLPLPASSSASPAARATGGPGRAPRRHPSPCCWPGAPRVRCVWWCVCVSLSQNYFLFSVSNWKVTLHMWGSKFKKGKKKIQKITLFFCFFVNNSFVFYCMK